MMKKVLIFTDMGIDDSIALYYAHLNKDIKIIGVVVDYGNVSRQKALINSQYLFQVFNLSKDIPIIRGAEFPLTGEQPSYYPEIHGPHGLGPITPNQVQGISVGQFLEIEHLIEKYENELIIVNMGRLTSLATLFILNNCLMKKVKEYYIMGGAFYVPGNVTSFAEANFHADPLAVEIVLSNAENTTLLPLNATSKAIITPQMINYIDYFDKSRVLKPLLKFYNRVYMTRDPHLKGSPVHDVLTLMAFTHPEFFSFYSYSIQIEKRLEIASRGQSILDTSFSDKRKHRVALDLNYQNFFNHFLLIMSGKQEEYNTI